MTLTRSSSTPRTDPPATASELDKIAIAWVSEPSRVRCMARVVASERIATEFRSKCFFRTSSSNNLRMRLVAMEGHPSLIQVTEVLIRSSLSLHEPQRGG